MTDDVWFHCHDVTIFVTAQITATRLLGRIPEQQDLLLNGKE
jgi:hypothetical protein